MLVDRSFLKTLHRFFLSSSSPQYSLGQHPLLSVQISQHPSLKLLLQGRQWVHTAKPRSEDSLPLSGLLNCIGRSWSILRHALLLAAKKWHWPMLLASLFLLLVPAQLQELYICERNPGSVLGPPSLSLFFLFRAAPEKKVPSFGIQSELQLQAYATGTATPDSSHFCNLLHSLRQCQILNSLSKARDRTCILTKSGP